MTCLEVADRVCKHLVIVQSEDEVWKLQRFDKDEFERNWSVIKHLRTERAETPIDLESVKQSVLAKRNFYLA